MSSAAEARGNPIFILSALCCAFLSIILFYDIHFLRDLEDMPWLIVLAITSFLSLYHWYRRGLRGVQARQQKASRGERHDADGEALWFVVFQGNFMYFSVFALFAYIILPQFEGGTPASLPFPWLHAAMSILPASLFLLGVDRGVY